MGLNKSKMAVESTPKPDPIQRLRNRRLAQLVDPRSPSCGINRTPIQVSGATSAVQEVQEEVGSVFVDPRSPTVGIVRTPLRDSVKVRVSSLARQLSAFFHNDVMVGESAPVSFAEHHSTPSVEQQDELSSNEPLLPPPHSCDSLSEPTKCPSISADCSSSMGYGSFCSSPFVVIGEVQVEGGTDADTTIDEAEEAVFLGQSPIKRELSLSMLGCREGVYSPECFPSAEERPSTPLPPLEDKQDVDHSYAQSCITSEPVPVQSASVPVQEAILPPSTADTPQSPEQEIVVEEIVIVPGQGLQQKSTSANSEPNDDEVLMPIITFPKFDTSSPSRAVFKPQWLGVGFGASGVRARGVQNRMRGPSSPRSTHRPTTDENENKVVLNKQKQRGKTIIGEGRSPLQILKETNSPRKNTTQMKMKVSTPEKPRFGQMDRRALILALNKENQ